MSTHQSRTPYDQDLLPDLTQVMSEELQRHKGKAQEEAQLEAERQEQAQLEEERACAEAEAQKVEAACKAEEAWKAAESQWADALVGSSTRAGSTVEVMNPHCLCCTQTNTTCLCNTDSKKKHLACNQCNELKECCQWLVEGETGLGGASDEGEDMGEGPSMKKTSGEVETGSITSMQMDCLIKAVKHVADNVTGLAVAQKEALRNFYWFTWSYETYVKEHLEFLVPDVPSDWDTTDEEDRDVEGLNEELEGLRREEEGKLVLV
ncbi:hypothetical protein M404DRAFT_18270 [Pisolithus tinctorius Marx 270]|uniref:Uncharacterized protein n=1 Tax=Pisolithus tinctorius Marx 270 TaxID=870435 RepID=A0A0C3PY27_PISTI|nr:hypothetical protein M404DRAFT_18270 [Pisolithus tinctorius Marx 270]